jgi:hypothetical protein
MREKIRRAAFVMTCTGSNQAWLRRFAPEARERVFLNYRGVVLDRFAPRLPDDPVDPARSPSCPAAAFFRARAFPISWKPAVSSATAAAPWIA